MAKGFSRLDETAAEGAQPLTPEPVENTEAPPRQLTLFGAGDGKAASALMALTEVTDNSGDFFPVLQQTSGDQGGTLVPPPFVAQDIANLLPQGRKTITCMYLAYRTSIIAWPDKYDKDAEEPPEGRKPAWQCNISCHDAEGMKLAMEACKKYQYCKKELKGNFDFAASEVGHLRCSLQLLVYFRDTNDVLIIQTPNHFNSVEKTGDQLKRQVNAATGNIDPFPCKISPKTESVKTWKVHSLEIAQHLDKPTWTAFEEWEKGVREDPEKMAKILEWINCADRPITDEIKARLRKAATLQTR